MNLRSSNVTKKEAKELKKIDDQISEKLSAKINTNDINTKKNLDKDI